MTSRADAFLRDLGFTELAPIPSWDDRRELWDAVEPVARERVIVASEVAPPIGVRGLEMALARGWLRARKSIADESRDVIVVIASRVPSATSMERLGGFARNTIGSSVRWIVTDGSRVWRGGGLRPAPEMVSESPPPAFARRRSAAVRSNPITDGMLLCAKALCSMEIGSRWFGDPTRRRPGAGAGTEARRSTAAHEIHARSGAALRQAHRFLEVYEKHHFLDRRGATSRLAQRDRLVAEFATRTSFALRDGVRAAPRYGDLDAWLRRAATRTRIDPIGARGRRVAIGAHVAAERFRIRAAAGVPVLLYVEGTIHAAASHLELELEPERGAEILVVRAPFPRAIFDWALPPDDRFLLPTVDLLQCLIDARAHPQRGFELAQAIEKAHPALSGERNEG